MGRDGDRKDYKYREMKTKLTYLMLILRWKLFLKHLVLNVSVKYKLFSPPGDE